MKLASLEEKLTIEAAPSNLEAYRTFLDGLRDELTPHQYDMAIAYGRMMLRRQGQEKFDVIKFLTYLQDPTQTMPRKEYDGPEIKADFSEEYNREVSKELAKPRKTLSWTGKYGS